MTWGCLIIGLPHYNGNITGMLGLQTKVHITIGNGKHTTYKDCDDWEMVHENMLAAL